MAEELKPPHRDYTKVGEITIVLFKDMKSSAHYAGLSEPLAIRLLTSSIFELAKRIVRDGGKEEGEMIMVHCAGINRMTRELMMKLTKEVPLIIIPEIMKPGDS